MTTSHTRSLKQWTTALSIGLCVLLSAMGYLIWSDSRTGKTTSTAEIEASSIRIQRDGFDDMRLAKKNELWQFESPCKMMANEQRLSPLLDALAPAAHQYAASEVDLEAAGLLDTQTIIYINETEHRIGDTDLSGERRYLQRGNTVEFTAEWVLSLVNGGVTALAQLEIFPAGLTRVTVTGDSGMSKVLSLAEDLALWQDLTAQQIAPWPLAEIEMNAAYKVQTVDAGGQNQSYTVYSNDSLTAVMVDDAQCAYLLPADALPHSPS